MQAILEPQSLADASQQDLMREMLVRLGENPDRDGLRDTPEPMERSMQYLTKGYHEDPEEVLLGARFDVGYDEMVTVKDIDMFSLCEHHLLPFFGRVHVAYIPRGKVIGLRSRVTHDRKLVHEECLAAKRKDKETSPQISC